MPECRSVDELNSYVRLYVLRVIQDIADEVREDVYKDVRQEYNDSIRRISLSNKDEYFQYEHTFDVLESISQPKAKLVGKTIEVEIYYDSSKITPFLNKNNYWNSHMDIIQQTTWNGASIPEMIPVWLERGTESGLAPREGWGIMEKWCQMLKRTLKGRVQRELKARYGLKVK